MPWTGSTFKAKHNHKLNKSQAAKGARVATAMINAGVPEGEAIATGNARAEGKKPKKRKDGLREYAQSVRKRLK